MNCTNKLINEIYKPNEDKDTLKITYKDERRKSLTLMMLRNMRKQRRFNNVERKSKIPFISAMYGAPPEDGGPGGRF